MMRGTPPPPLHATVTKETVFLQLSTHLLRRIS